MSNHFNGISVGLENAARLFAAEKMNEGAIVNLVLQVTALC